MSSCYPAAIQLSNFSSSVTSGPTHVVLSLSHRCRRPGPICPGLPGAMHILWNGRGGRSENGRKRRPAVSASGRNGRRRRRRSSVGRGRRSGNRIGLGLTTQMCVESAGWIQSGSRMNNRRGLCGQKSPRSQSGVLLRRRFWQQHTLLLPLRLAMASARCCQHSQFLWFHLSPSPSPRSLLGFLSHHQRQVSQSLGKGVQRPRSLSKARRTPLVQHIVQGRQQGSPRWTAWICNNQYSANRRQNNIGRNNRRACCSRSGRSEVLANSVSRYLVSSSRRLNIYKNS